MTYVEEIVARLRRAGYRITEGKSTRGTGVTPKLFVTGPRHDGQIPLKTAIAEVLEEAVGEQMMKEARS
jgi:hypothetical protein